MPDRNPQVRSEIVRAPVSFAGVGVSGGAAMLIGIAGLLGSTFAMGQPGNSPSSRAVSSASPAPGPAQTPTAVAPLEGGDRPVSAGRVVRMFDFEERAFNAEPVPRYWFRAQHNPPARERPGFPRWNEAGFDYTVAHSGSASVKLPVGGGSTSLTLAATLIAILPDADLEVSAFVRTAGLKTAKGFLVARLIDQSGKPLPDMQVRSDGVQSENAWQRIAVHLPATPKQAAFLQVELLALQPDQYGVGLRDVARDISIQDHDGAVYFDDVVVRQLPRLSLRSVGGPVIAADQTAQLAVEVRDLAGEPLTAKLEVRDAAGEVVASQVRPMDVGGDRFVWSVPVKRAGWYSASVEVSGGTIAASATQLTFLRLPEQRTRTRTGGSAGEGAEGETVSVAGIADRFGPRQIGLLAEELGGADPAGVLPLVSATNAAVVTLSATVIATEGPNSDGLADLAESMIASGLRVQMAWPEVPRELLAALGRRELDPVGLADQDEAKWFPKLEAVLDRFGRRITGWRFGRLPSDLGATPPDLGVLHRRTESLGAVLRSHAVGSRLITPWRSDWDGSKGGVETTAGVARTVLIPGNLAARQVARAIGETGPADLYVLQGNALLGAATPLDQAIDTAQRLVCAWAASAGESGAATFAAERSWIMSRPERGVGGLGGRSVGLPGSPVAANGHLHPSPELAAVVGLSGKLLGRRVASVLRNDASGGEFLLKPLSGTSDRAAGRGGFDRGGALIAWSEEPGRYLERHVGVGPLRGFDLFGNRVALPAPDASGFVRIPLSPSPLVVEGIDAELVEFVSSIALTPSFIPASASVQELRLTANNPWSERVMVSAQLLLSEVDRKRGWSISPTSAQQLTLAPLASGAVGALVSVAPSEVVGERRITALISVEGERTYGPLKLAMPIIVGVPGLDVHITLLPQDGQVVATVTALNSGSRPRTLAIELTAPKQKRQDQSISQLLPGELAVRRFLLEDGPGLSGKKVRITAQDVESGERLNKLVDVP